MQQAGRVANKIAIVTGAASGIGQACALRLGQEGAFVLATDIDPAGAEATAGLIAAAGGQASAHAHDVAEESAWQTLVGEAVAAHGGLDVLVNNAGIAIGGSIIEMSLVDWRRQQSINLDGVFLGVKHALPAMTDSGGGSIINISSVAGIKGAANLAAYNATKGGVRLFTKGVAIEAARKGWNVRVNSVHPGIIRTAIWDKANPEFWAEMEDEDAGGANRIELEEMAAVQAPLGRVGDPGDIAGGVLFLASDDSSYMTGTELIIDGGICA
ncbi:MAG: glucose 1-dehydrogenase [Pseudomonadota bacterium]